MLLRCREPGWEAKVHYNIAPELPPFNMDLKLTYTRRKNEAYISYERGFHPNQSQHPLVLRNIPCSNGRGATPLDLHYKCSFIFIYSCGSEKAKVLTIQTMMGCCRLLFIISHQV